jgi:eukaryotic-like serine/threonine-protein kinase
VRTHGDAVPVRPALRLGGRPGPKSGAEAVVAAAGQRGRVLAERYELRDRLGQGGAGTVWRGHDRALDRAVAVKLLHADLAEDPDAGTRFRTEATAAAKLTHPNAVLVYDLGRDGDDDYLVMELVEGVNLADVLRDGPLAAGLAAHVGAQVAAALGTAHQAGIVHRDVKPGNVLLTGDGIAKLADFGIARALGAVTARLTRTGMVLGTARYLAPEQLRDEPIDARADVYALGLVMYEALSGRAPFGEGNAVEVAARRLTTSLPPLGELADGAPAGLVEVIDWATRVDPRERPGDGAELASALRRFAAHDAESAVARRIAAVPQRNTTPVASDRIAPIDPGPGAAGGSAPGGHRPPPPPPGAGAADPAGEAGATRALPTTTAQPRGRVPSVAEAEGTRALDRAAVRSTTGAAAGAAAARPAASGAGAGAGAGAGTAAPGGGGTDRDRPDGDGREPTGGHRASSTPRRLVLGAVAAVAILLVAIGLSAGGDEEPQDGGPATAPTPDGGEDEGGEEDQPIELAGSGDHDPQGDEQERSGDVGAAIDRDRDTFWPTETYTSADFGGLGKAGVGIWVELAGPTELDRVEVELGADGGALELWASADGPPSPDQDPGDWGTRLGGGPVPADRLQFPSLAGTEIRTLLLWFTELPEAGGGFRAEVREVRVYAD